MARSVIDPVTRIEGHLRVEMEVENGVVSDAWVSGRLLPRHGARGEGSHCLKMPLTSCSASAVFAPYPTPTRNYCC